MNDCRLLLVFFLLATIGLGAGCARDTAAMASIANELSENGNETAGGTYNRNLGALVAHDGLRRFDLVNGLGVHRRPEDLPSGPVATERRQLAALAAPVSDGRRMASGNTAGGEQRFEGQWRSSSQTLYLAPANGQSGDEPFAFSGIQSRSVEIDVVSAARQAYRLALVCDGPMEVVANGSTVRHTAGSRFILASGDQSRHDSSHRATDA